MSQPCFRILALFLVCCLPADFSGAAGGPAAPIVLSQALFQEQALSPVSFWEHVPMARVRLAFWARRQGWRLIHTLRSLIGEVDTQTLAAYKVAIALCQMDAYHRADRQAVMVITSDAASHNVEKIAQLFSTRERPVYVRRVESAEDHITAAINEERARGFFVPIGVYGSLEGHMHRKDADADSYAPSILRAAALSNPDVKQVWDAHHIDDLPRRYTSLGSKTNLAVRSTFLKQALENQFRDSWIESQLLQQRYPDYQFRHYDALTESGHVSKEGQGGWALILTRNDGEKDILWLRPLDPSSVRFQIDATTQEAEYELSLLFERLYRLANNPGKALRDTGEEHGELLFEEALVFNRKDDEDGGAWMFSRMKKRVEFFSQFPFVWAHSVNLGRIPENIQPLLQHVVARRQRWYEELARESPQRDASDQALSSGKLQVIQTTTEPSLEFVIQEILKNAFDAFARAQIERGRIMVHVSKFPDHLSIDISDNGIGIKLISTGPAGTFYVSGNSPPMGAMPNVEGGLHIGIPWSQVVIKLHEGSLQFFSPGIGGYRTTVRMEFPLDAIREKGPEVLGVAVRSDAWLILIAAGSLLARWLLSPVNFSSGPLLSAGFIPGTPIVEWLTSVLLSGVLVSAVVPPVRAFLRAA